MSKILITGAKGQLGTILGHKLSEQNKVIPLSSKELDITDITKVLECVQSVKPDIIINCASYNKVDDAEVEAEECMKVNELGVHNLAVATQKMSTLLVHISTDYVFDGNKNEPYTELDVPRPINIYGLSKYRGEAAISSIKENHLIIRTSWLYSDLDRKGNFFNTIYKLAYSRERLNVINDQIGTPTNAYELSDKIIELIKSGKTGLYHCSGEGKCSRYEFASKIVELIKAPCKVFPITTLEYGQKAERPKYSVLDNGKYIRDTGDSIAQWDKELQEFVMNIRK